MIDPTDAVRIEDATDKLFLREGVADGEIDGRPCAISHPIGSAALLFELSEHEGKPRVQWLVQTNAKAIFSAMVDEK